MKNILLYNHIGAKRFFLKEESYFNFDLPLYFKFQNLLNNVSKEFKNKPLRDFCTNNPKDYEYVNYTLINNKDGKFAWRPMQLIHPVLYASLINEITSKNNWGFITKRFKQFARNPKIICLSIPIESKSKISDKANMIIHWWNEVEQKSIQLALEYDYVMHTDIRDCYGSIYTHSIAWALHTKKTAKAKRNDKNLIGNQIDGHLQSMSNAQTNGIPQGSALMDFISEMILGYADLLLTEELKKDSVSEYKILRYRDDYRVFVNNPQTAELILKHLTHVLIGLGMRLNDQKTIISSNVVEDSIKEDKLFFIANKQQSTRLQNSLLIIHSLANQYPNSGSLIKSLDKFYKRIANMKKINENIHVLISIVTDIAFKNPRGYSISATILSKLINLIPSEKEQKDILKTISKKFDKIPNTGHLKVWLQRLSYKIDNSIVYEETLCKKVNKPKTEIWNSAWLNKKMKDIISNTEIIDRKKLSKMKKVISSSETKLFELAYGNNS